MKKTIILLTGLLLLLVASGCSNTAKSTHPTSPIQASHKQTIVKYYQKLNSADQKKVKFNFSAKQNNLGYLIAVKVKNNTDKIIKLDKSKFSLKQATNTTPSDLNGVITIKPKHAKTINNLFQKLTVSELAQTNNYVTYHNSKIATTHSMLSQKVLNSLSNDDNNSTDNQTDNSTQQTQTDNSATQNSDQSTQTEQPSNTQATQLTEAQARQKLADSGYGDTSDLTGRREDGYWDFYAGLGYWFVYDNGYISNAGNHALNQYLKDHPDADTDTDDSDSGDAE